MEGWKAKNKPASVEQEQKESTEAGGGAEKSKKGRLTSKAEMKERKKREKRESKGRIATRVGVPGVRRRTELSLEETAKKQRAFGTSVKE